MRYALILALSTSLIGCGASMVTTRGDSTSAFAPTNETQSKGGTIRYSSAGADSVVKRRREDAYRQMHNSCNGPYKIVSESIGKDSGGSIYGRGSSYSVSDPWVYLEFSCE